MPLSKILVNAWDFQIDPLPKDTKNCKTCLGKGYVLMITPHLNAKLYRRVIPCFCIGQTVRIEED